MNLDPSNPRSEYTIAASITPSRLGPSQPSNVFLTSTTNKTSMYAGQNRPVIHPSSSSLSNSAPQPSKLRRTVSLSDKTEPHAASSYSTFWATLESRDPFQTFNPDPFDPSSPFPVFHSSNNPIESAPIQDPSNADSPMSDSFLTVLPSHTPSEDPFLTNETPSRSNYETFFASLNAPRPPAKPLSYDSLRSSRSSNSALFSSPSENTLINPSIPSPHTSTPLGGRSFGTNSTNNLDFSKFGQFTSSDNFEAGFHPFTAPASPAKRRKEPDPDSPSKAERKRQRAMTRELSVQEKLDKVFDLFKELEWTLSEFMHHAFAHKDVHRSKRHGVIVERYLSG